MIRIENLPHTLGFFHPSSFPENLLRGNSPSLLPLILRQLNPIGACNGPRPITERENDKPVESPSIITMRIKSNSHSACLNRSPGTRVENVKSEWPIVVVVAELTKIRISASGDDLGSISDCDCYMAVAIFVFIVCVERDGGASKSCCCLAG